MVAKDHTSEARLCSIDLESDMETTTLGITGLRVSRIAFGTWQLGGEWGQFDEDAAITAIRRARDLGVNFFDTAQAYGFGASEHILGKALRDELVRDRNELVIATKGGLRQTGSGLVRDASPEWLRRGVDASLTALGIDHIDLYQVHWPDPAVPIEQTLATLNDLVQAGKIRYFGLSNYLGWELQRGIDACERNGWSPIASHQPQYSLVSREIELETLPLCAANDIAVLAWSPLGGGVLTGKYAAADARPSDTRLGASEAQAKRRLSEHNLRVAQAVGEVAAELGKSSAQVALNWVLHRPGVTSPLVGARSISQLDDNLGAEGWALEPEQVTRLDESSRLPLPYPHDLYRMINKL
jgi:aryl-alcohol dehydrogenase-like predicted oxidoreductase